MHKTVKHINTIKKINKNINIRVRSVLIEKSPFIIKIQGDIFYTQHWYCNLAGAYFTVRNATSDDLHDTNIISHFNRFFVVSKEQETLYMTPNTYSNNFLILKRHAIKISNTKNDN